MTVGFISCAQLLVACSHAGGARERATGEHTRGSADPVGPTGKSKEPRLNGGGSGRAVLPPTCPHSQRQVGIV